jgi:cyclophilin family peptidyl-prolyl cis-trans isomerase
MEKLKDENFALDHDKRGVISMVNKGPHTATNHFMIMFKDMPTMDKKSVVFGQVVDGEDCLRKIQQVSTKFENPDYEIKISGCKLLFK